MTANSKYNDLIEALRQGETAEVEALTQKALDSGANPLDLIQSVLVPTLTDVGNQFQAFTIFLPELMAAGEAATAATAIIEEAIAASGQKTSSPGTVLLGTVESDVHDIGKNIVNTLFNFKCASNMNFEIKNVTLLQIDGRQIVMECPTPVELLSRTLLQRFENHVL